MIRVIIVSRVTLVIGELVMGLLGLLMTTVMMTGKGYLGIGVGILVLAIAAVSAILLSWG